jgi:predicted nucleotide-binding protein (sugar kinase/HSP70/actin superfamily)
MQPFRTLLLPSMGLYSYAIAWTLQSFGVNARVLEPAGRQAVELALSCLRGAECLPCLVTLGDLMAELKKTDDARGLAYFMPTAKGPCRFGLYRSLQELTLKELGAKVAFFSLDASEGYSFGVKAKGVELALFKAIVAADILEAVRAALAPQFHGRDVGELDDTYGYAKEALRASLCNGGQDLKATLARLNRVFAPIKKAPCPPSPPLVAFVGEIFIRGNPVANGGIVAKLEALGLEVAPAPMAEWLKWVFLTHARRLAREGRRLEALKAYLKLFVLERAEGHLRALFPGFQYRLESGRISQIAKKAFPYAKECFGGEGLLMLGKARSLLEDGAAGVVCVYPFGCLPGNIVRVLSKGLAREYRRPWLNVSIEPLEGTHLMTRLEAFAGQVLGRAKRPPSPYAAGIG